MDDLDALPPELWWWELAACRGRYEQGHDPWFDLELRKEAIAICETCPVREPCLADALATPVREDAGIRGGTTEGRRVAMRKERRQVPARTACEVCQDRTTTKAGRCGACRRDGRAVA